MSAAPFHLLSIPLELREYVYTLLLHPTDRIAIREAPPRIPSPGSTDLPSTTPSSSESDSWAIMTHPPTECCVQLLCTCSQIYTEACPLLYSHRTFDLSARESMQLLLHNIGAHHFAHIRNIVLAWDSLEEFARALNREEWVMATAGLETIEMSDWWARRVQAVEGGGLARVRRFSTRDRTWVQAAQDVVDRHGSLKVVVEREFKGRVCLTGTSPEETLRKKSFRKIKWRFLRSEGDARSGERVIALDLELQTLKRAQGEAGDEGMSMPMMDPF